MSRWTHALCTDCYAALEPGRTPTLLVEPIRETCCRCGDPVEFAVYYREDPAVYACKGVNGTHATASPPQ